MPVPDQTSDRYRDRVALTHRQARFGFIVTSAFAIGAAGAAVLPHNTGAWLPLHLFLVGSVLSAISTSTQLLAVTWSSSAASSSLLVRVQQLVLGGGALAVAIGRETDTRPITDLGGLVVMAALALLATLLWRTRITAGTDRFAPAIDTYLVAIAFAMGGVALGVVIASSQTGTWWTQARSAHIDANVLGFVGLILAGTLPFFVATQARMKMSPRATPRRLHLSTVFMSCAVATTLGGRLIEQQVVVAVGYGGYAATLVWLTSLLPRVGRRQFRWGGPRLWQIVAALGWWFAMAVLLAVAELSDIGDHTNIIRALVIGGYAQFLAASLAYFGPVLRSGGHERLTGGFAITRSWLSLLAANTAGAAALIGYRPLLAGALGIWGLDIAVRCLVLVKPRRARSTTRTAQE